MENIRVLRVIARLNMGGPAQQAGILSGRRMDTEGFETLLVHGSLAPGEESMAGFAEKEGARMVMLPDLAQPVSPLRDLRALGQLIRVLRRFQPHIVHTHTAKAGFLGRLAALSVRPRPVIVHTFHGHVLSGYFGRVKSGGYRFLERALARVSDCLIGVSQATVDDLVGLGIAPRERFRVIPLGLDLEQFAALDAAPSGDLRGELDVAEDEVLLTYVGRVVPIKRLDVLLHAFECARRRGAPIRLAIVGDGELRSDLEQTARELDVLEYVRFLGYRSDLVRIARATDLAVLSSDNEGTPVSLIEAAAAARPAVATSVGGVSEVVTPETGLLVPPGDPEAFCTALMEAIRDRRRIQLMGAAARERAVERYSSGRLLHDIESLYEEMVSSKMRRAYSPAADDQQTSDRAQ